MHLALEIESVPILVTDRSSVGTGFKPAPPRDKLGERTDVECH
jgi:hypothetical protein